ncbi:MAG: TetR/AcrR family transcriptional regulator [Solirubrobacterales bacterium]
MEVEDQIIDAAREEFSEFGVRRASMESVAKRAGLGRATIYRRFSSKSELVAATFQREARLFVDQLDEIWDGPGSLEDRMTGAWIQAMELLRDHTLINQLLRKDPESILPLVTVDGTPLLELIASLYADRLGREVGRGALPEGAQIELAAEMLARVGVSLALNPAGGVPTDDPESVRRFVTLYFLDPLRAKS